MKFLGLAGFSAVALLATMGEAQANGGSFVCKDGFGALKEIETEVGGSSGFNKIVSQYVSRWDAQEARRLCAAYAAGEPVTITCLNGQRDWTAIKASIPAEYFGLGNQQLASANAAEREKGNGYREAMAYCRSVGAIK
jgi:ABC-type sugar transport system substrate-binding protein